MTEFQLKITESQRLCLSIMLRDCQQVVQSLLETLEDNYSQISTQDLARDLDQPCKQLLQIQKAAATGTFCAIPEEQCQHVASFVRCEGKPVASGFNGKLKIIG